MERVNSNNKRRLSSTKIARNTWGDSGLKFGVLDALSCDATTFLNAPLPTNDEIANAIPVVSLEDTSSSSNGPENNVPSILFKRKRSQDNMNIEANLFGEICAENVPLSTLDAYIATFIQAVRIAYSETSSILLRYLQILLYVSVC